MKKQILTSFSFTLLVISNQLLAFNTGLLRSDKELSSNFMVNSKAVAAYKRFKTSSTTGIEGFRTTYRSILSNSLDKVLKNKDQCNLTVIKEMRRELVKFNLSASKTPFDEFLHLARQQKIIDDVFAKFLTKQNRIYNKLSYYAKKPANPKWSSKVRFRVSNKPKVIAAYKKIQSDWSFTDGVDHCIETSFARLAAIIAKEYKVKSGNWGYLYNIMISTNLYALKKGYISKHMWNFLEVLRFERIVQDKLDISGYVDKVKNAKNILKGELSYIRKDDPNAVESNRTKRYLQLYVDRYKGLTRREKLYEKYSSQQILLLADILIKTSKRMNADKSVIQITYVEDDGDDTPDETYLISPMEQYRMSLKMLKKDYSNAMMSSLFGGVSIDYEDIVMAALETGAITYDELDYVVQYELFWNPPKAPVWKQVLGFFFDFAGTASFYLPAPFNVVGAIGLVFTESKIFQGNKEPNANGNVNSIF